MLARILAHPLHPQMKLCHGSSALQLGTVRSTGSHIIYWTEGGSFRQSLGIESVLSYGVNPELTQRRELGIVEQLR